MKPVNYQKKILSTNLIDQNSLPEGRGEFVSYGGEVCARQGQALHRQEHPHRP